MDPYEPTTTPQQLRWWRIGSAVGVLVGVAVLVFGDVSRAVGVVILALAAANLVAASVERDRMRK